jgi:hypothetical protein
VPKSWWRAGWTRETVYRIVRNRAMCGEYEADKRRGAVIRVPAIVTEREWQEAQRSLIQCGRRGLRRTMHFYLLEGIATCACGAQIGIRSATRNPRRTNGNPSPAAYVCFARRKKQGCAAPIVRCAETDALVWAALCDEIEQPELIGALELAAGARAADARDWRADAEGYTVRLANLEKVESAIMVRFRRGAISEGALDTELAAITRERSMLATQVDNAQRAAARAAPDEPAAEVVMARLRQLAATKIPEDRRTVVNLLVDPTSVVLDHGVIRMTLVVEAAACRPAAGDGARSAVVPVTAVGSRTHREDMRVILDVVA